MSLTIEETAWMEGAACAGMDLCLFFPEQEDGWSVDEPKAICAACPVAADCLAWALKHRIAFGVFGGTSEKQRRVLRGQQVRAGLVTTCIDCGCELVWVRGSGGQPFKRCERCRREAKNARRRAYFVTARR